VNRSYAMSYIENKIGKLIGLPYKASLSIAFTLISSALLITKSASAVPMPQNTNDSLSTNDSVEMTEVDFNSSFIHGSGVDVSRFMKENPISPGVYDDVKVIVNGNNQGKHSIRFELAEGESTAEPCFKLTELESIGLRIESDKIDLPVNEKVALADQCYTLKTLIKDSRVSYNAGDFELSLTVPQFNVVQHPRGYIDPSLWESGGAVGFLDYSSNIYSTFNGGNSGAASNTYNSNIGVSAGMNVGEWRFRKRFNSNWSNNSSMKTQNLYGYAATDITTLKSQLLLGDTNSQGRVFDSYALRGVTLTSDDRMLPEAIRSYSPIIRGVAETNARVTVTQLGKIVYETVVTPGAFELTDIGSMTYGGDLQMTITESDGRTRIQRIPFSAPPMLLYQGVSRFDLSAGQLNDNMIDSNPTIVQGAYHYGLGNNYTVYGGAQVAEKYRSVAVGNAFNTPIGGISMDVTHAKSELAGDKTSSGNSYKVDYSKYVGETDTNLTLAAYRYSSSGYYTFREASMDYYGNSNGSGEIDYRTRNRLSLDLSQRVANNMSVNLNSSLYSYWGSQEPSQQYSVSFNHSLSAFSYSLTALRTKNGRSNSIDTDNNKEYENSYLLSVNVPIGSKGNSKPLFNSLYSVVSHDDAGNTQLQANASGSQGSQNELSYGVGTLYSNRSGSSSSSQTVNGNMSYRSPVGQLGVTGSVNNSSSKQLSLSASGSLVAHQGGLTAGPRLGDAPFAIINAEGATGARVFNGQGAKVDRNGYAILPGLTPYRENTVAIDYKDLPSSVDIMENHKVVIPRAGAMIPVNMTTMTGAAMMLVVRDENKEFLPIGTDLVDASGMSQSIVGQGGMAFIRGWDPTQPLTATLNGGDTCHIQSDTKVNAAADAAQITQLEVTCLRR
jgi:outer membrane usher protein